MSHLQIFGQCAVLDQDMIDALEELPKIAVFFVPLRHLTQCLGNGCQLLVASQPSPVKGLTAVAVHRISDSLANLSLYADQFPISRQGG